MHSASLIPGNARAAGGERVVQADTGPVAGLGMALRAHDGKQLTEHGQHSGIPARPGNRRDPMVQRYPVQRLAVRRLIRGRQDGGLNDRDAMQQEIGRGFEDERRRQADQCGVDCIDLAGIGDHCGCLQWRRQGLVQARHPPHDACYG